MTGNRSGEEGIDCHYEMGLVASTPVNMSGKAPLPPPRRAATLLKQSDNLRCRTTARRKHAVVFVRGVTRLFQNR